MALGDKDGAILGEIDGVTLSFPNKVLLGVNEIDDDWDGTTFAAIDGVALGEVE